jgi:hypothetical protein
MQPNILASSTDVLFAPDIEELIPERHAPVRSNRRSVSQLLGSLDSQVRPGITTEEFQGLFVKCECGLITTHRVFEEHVCAREVIDLTSDN